MQIGENQLLIANSEGITDGRFHTLYILITSEDIFTKLTMMHHTMHNNFRLIHYYTHQRIPTQRTFHFSVIRQSTHQLAMFVSNLHPNNYIVTDAILKSMKMLQLQ